MLDTGIPARFPAFYVNRKAELVPRTIKKPVSPIDGEQGVFDMFDHLVDFRRIAVPVLLGLSVSLAACGGSSGPEGPDTGTVALLLTDLPADDLREINLSLTGATLIGDEGQQGVTVYDGNTRVNLLDLEIYSQPIAIAEVPAGTYTKLRLQVDDVEIIDNEGEPHYPRPPANGKIDLLEPGGIEVVPGRTLVAHVDMDAKNSVHVAETGNGEYRLRPVVRVEFRLDGLPDGLVRAEGLITEETEGDAGSFVLCLIDNPDTCLDVSLAEGACVFDEDGIPIDPIDADTLAVDDAVVVIGYYSDGDGDGNPEIDAIVVEKGEPAQVKGIVTAAPDGGLFLLIDSGGVEVTVELQDDCTKILGADGEVLTPAALQVGQGIEVEGVLDGNSAALRAALIVLDSDDDPEQLSGTIGSGPSEPEFVLVTGAGDIDVCVNTGATITVIDDGSSDEGSFSAIQEGRTAYVFGELNMTDGCFYADDVVVDIGD
jgi:hypothetical protein